LGIGRPAGKMPVHAYVLQDFNKQEYETVREMLDTAVRAVETYIQDGISLTMSKHNGQVQYLRQELTKKSNL
jgi:peptidyl-tRNA hydrolase